MSGIDIPADGAERSGSELPAGIYTMVVVAATDGASASGKRRLRLKLKVLDDGPHLGKAITDDLYATKEAGRRVVPILKAFGLTAGADSVYHVDATDLLGRRVKVEVVVEDRGGEERPRVRGFGGYTPHPDGPFDPELSKRMELVRGLYQHRLSCIPMTSPEGKGKDPGKHPTLKNWPRRPPLDLADALAHMLKGGNLGIATGRAPGAEVPLIVLDPDINKAPDQVPAALAALQLPPTWTVRTGSGNEHYYFRMPDGAGAEGLRNSTGEVAAFIDIRTTGGCVVAPGSIHPRTKGIYDWVPGCSPADVELAEFPRGLLAELLAQQQGPGAPSSSEPRDHAQAGNGTQFDIDAEPGVPEGSRNATAARLAGRLLAGGLDPSEVIEGLRTWNQRCQPPLGDAELQRVVGSVADADRRNHPERHVAVDLGPGQTADKRRTRAAPTGNDTSDGGEGQGEGGDLDADKYTDLANARLLVQFHGADLRYCHPWAKWLPYDGMRWKVDDTGETARRARAVVDAMVDAAKVALGGAEEVMEAAKRDGLGKDAVKALAAELKAAAKQFGHAVHSMGERSLRAMQNLAESEPGIPVLPADLDRDPWLLNVRNGTLDLRTGLLRPHDRRELITKLAGTHFAPEATAPTWIEFLNCVLGGDPGLIAFLQRFIGWSLTGDVSEHYWIFNYGTGANGKTTFENTVLSLLGDYGTRAAPDLLLVKRGETHPTELADLHGVRLASCSEVGEGRKFDETLIKRITGGDMQKARRMREDFWSFFPSAKLILAANHRPRVTGTDYGFWRRICLVPFQVIIPPEKRDPQLPERLRKELPGILNWALHGLAEWREGGLRPPARVLTATTEYRAEQDVLAAFLADRCYQLPGISVPKGTMYDAYTAWATKNGVHAVSQLELGQKLRERGFGEGRAHGGVRVWKGVGLRDGHEDHEGQGEPSGDARAGGEPGPVTAPSLENDGPQGRETDGDASSGLNEKSKPGSPTGAIRETASPDVSRHPESARGIADVRPPSPPVVPGDGASPGDHGRAATAHPPDAAPPGSADAPTGHRKGPPTLTPPAGGWRAVDEGEEMVE